MKSSFLVFSFPSRLLGFVVNLSSMTEEGSKWNFYSSRPFGFALRLLVELLDLFPACLFSLYLIDLPVRLIELILDMWNLVKHERMLSRLAYLASTSWNKAHKWLEESLENNSSTIQQLVETEWSPKSKHRTYA